MDEAVEKRFEKFDERVTALEHSDTNKVEKLSSIETEVKYITKTIDRLDAAINLLISKPSKLQDNVITAVITALAVSAVAYFLGK